MGITRAAATGVNPDWAKEYFADCQATITTVISAKLLDSVPPELPLGSAIFALACLDIRQRALCILRTGKETESDADQGTHPNARDRASNVISFFRQFFNVTYHSDGTCDLEFALREESPEVHGFSGKYSEIAYEHANILLAIWKLVKQRLLEDFRSKRPLHPLWR